MKIAHSKLTENKSVRPELGAVSLSNSRTVEGCCGSTGSPRTVGSEGR